MYTNLILHRTCKMCLDSGVYDPYKHPRRCISGASGLSSRLMIASDGLTSAEVRSVGRGVGSVGILLTTNSNVKIYRTMI